MARAQVIVFLFLLSSSLSPSSSSTAQLTFSEPSFHSISTHERHLYLNPTATAIPCGYLVPTELDIFRYAYLQSPTGTVSTVTPEDFNPNKCTIMIVRLLFGAYELFGPYPRNYTRPTSTNGETLCYLLITDYLSIQHPIIAQSILMEPHQHPKTPKALKYCPWHVFVMKRLMYPNPAKTMKAIKLSLFRIFPYAKFILYYDLKYQLVGNPLKFIRLCDEQMTQANTSHAILKHNSTKSAEDEFIGAKDRLKFQHSQGVVRNISKELTDIARQHRQYSSEGFFDEVRDKRTPLVDSAIIVFKNRQPGLHRFFCAWLNEVILFSRRDQLSYPYVEHKLGSTGFKIPQLIALKYFKKIPHGYVRDSKEKEGKKKGH